MFQFYLKPYIIYFQDIAQFTKMASYLDSGRRIYCRPYVYCRPYEVDPLVDSRAWNALSNVLLQKKLATGSWHGHVTLEACLR